MGLGDLAEKALSSAGITKERVVAVKRWLGLNGSCGCEDRKQRLNAFGFWVTRVLNGKTEKAEEHLEKLMDEK